MRANLFGRKIYRTGSEINVVLPLIPFEALEGLMKKAFIQQEVPAGLFWDALLKANLYTPLIKGTKSQTAAEDEDVEEYPMLLGMDAEGKNIVWLFTSPDVMTAYIEQDLPYLELGSQAMFTKLHDVEYDVVLIGPDGLTLGLHPQLIKTLSEGKVPEAGDHKVKYVPKDAEVYIGAPTDETGPLEEKFSELFQQIPDVQEASFVQIGDEAGSRLLLGLKLERESRDVLKGVAKKVADAVEGILPKGNTMDITLINGSLKEGFAKWGKVFYKK